MDNFPFLFSFGLFLYTVFSVIGDLCYGFNIPPIYENKLNKMRVIFDFRLLGMQLYKMQDLGGCRVIVDTIEQVYKSLNQYKTSSIRHILKREYDYIANPKPSGYRSYHIVYQFHSDKKDTYNKNM